MRDEGVLTFYSLTNTAEAGMMPTEGLVETGTAYYSRRTIGVTRLYAAQGANQRIDSLARCHNTPTVPSGTKFVILEDGDQYRIDAAQQIVELDAVDLTLRRLEEFYDVANVSASNQT